MTAKRKAKVVSLVGPSLARMVAEHYDDFPALEAAMRRYHPNATRKEINAAFDAVPRETVRKAVIGDLIAACSAGVDGGPDLPRLFGMITTIYTAPLPLRFWVLIAQKIPPDSAAWLKRQVERHFGQEPSTGDIMEAWKAYQRAGLAFFDAVVALDEDLYVRFMEELRAEHHRDEPGLPSLAERMREPAALVGLSIPPPAVVDISEALAEVAKIYDDDPPDDDPGVAVA